MPDDNKNKMKNTQNGREIINKIGYICLDT